MDSGSFIETLPDLLLNYPLITYIPVVDMDNVNVYYTKTIRGLSGIVHLYLVISKLISNLVSSL